MPHSVGKDLYWWNGVCYNVPLASDLKDTMNSIVCQGTAKRTPEFA
jgi:hypothetical protein